jgi:ubiquinone/menaquinone biosynthesis C-methylase UbiE
MYTFEPRNRTLLDDSARLSFQNPDLILSEAEPRPGQGPDIGCGTDFLTFPLANRGCENGHLNAVDTSSTMLKKEGLR